MLALAAMLPVAAQQVEVTSIMRLLQEREEPAYYPVLNPSGDHLVYQTSDDGMRLYDLASDQVSTITTDVVTGFDVCWGNDDIVYFVSSVVGEDNLIYRTSNSFDITTGQRNRLTEPQHGAVQVGRALKPQGNHIKSAGEIGEAAWTEGSRVHVMVGGEERVFSPVDSWAGYLWASLSPDGKRVAFFAAGKGIVIIDLRGQMLAMLGNYEMPRWYNNDYLVSQNAKDDGHQFTSSQIVLLKADGTYKTELTKPESMTMQPTCGGGKIVYTTIDGLLYEMKINIYE